MRLLIGLLLGLVLGYGYGFYDGRRHTEPTLLKLTKSLQKPNVSAVQRAESLRADAEAKLQQNANAKMKAAQ